MIRKIDVLNLMDDFDANGNPLPFSIKFYTIEGEAIIIDLAVKCVGKRGNQIILDKKPKNAKTKKNPNHFKNSTRNIYIPQSGQIRKCNIHLITQFNGQKVVY